MTEPSRLSEDQELVDEGARSTGDLTEAAAEGLRWIAYARVIIEVLLFASAVFLARLIPPSAFGIFAVIVIVQELAVTLPMEGVGGALVQRQASGPRAPAGRARADRPHRPGDGRADRARRDLPGRARSSTTRRNS